MSRTVTPSSRPGLSCAHPAVRNVICGGEDLQRPGYVEQLHRGEGEYFDNP